jgi:hypothetical protein
MLLPFRDSDFDGLGVGLANSGFEVFSPFLELLGTFPFQVVDIQKDVIMLAIRAGVVEKAHAFEAQPLPIGFHVFGFFFNKILRGKRALAMAAFPEHGLVPLGQFGAFNTDKCQQTECQTIFGTETGQ